METIQLYILSNSLIDTEIDTETLRYSLELKRNINLAGYSKDLASTLKNLSSIKRKKQPSYITSNILFVDDVSLNKNKLTNFLTILPEKFSKVKTVIYTGNTENEYINNLVACKIRGLLYKERISNSSSLKEIFCKKIINAIKTVNAGYTCIDDIFLPSIMKPLWMRDYIDDIRENQIRDLKLLSFREKQILIKITEGKKNQEISNELFISFHTVDSHYANIKNKLNIRSTNELIIFASVNKEMIKFLLNLKE